MEGQAGRRGRRRAVVVAALVAVAVWCAMVRPCAGSDIEHDDPVAPSQPGCSNSFVLVRLCFPFLPWPLPEFNLTTFHVGWGSVTPWRLISVTVG
jgi:hypothetical protein